LFFCFFFFCFFFLSFGLFFFAIALSIILQCMTSDYLFGILSIASYVSGAGTAYPFYHLSSHSVFSGVRVARSLV
jgi:hypothetical protein